MSSKSDIIRELDEKYGVLTSSPSYDSVESYKESIGAGKGKNYENNLVKTQKEKGVNAQASATNEDSGKSVSDLKSEQDARKKETIDVDAAKSKYEQTQKEYEDYLNSDEYKQKKTEREQQYKVDQMASLFADGYTPQMQTDEKEETLRSAKDVAEAEYNKAQDQIVSQGDLQAITDLSEEDKQALEAYAVNKVRDQNLPVELQNNPFFKTAEQEASDLISKTGKSRVDELAETFMRQENENLAEKATELGQKHGNDSPFLASLGTVGVNLASGLVGSVGQLQGAATNTGRYKTLDPNATGTALQTYSNAVRGQVQENIEGDVYDEQGNKVSDGGLLRDIGSIAYQGVMSAADSIAQATVGGAVGGAALAATNTFSQTMSEASKNGATPAQAATLATVTAGIEALSEEIPLDNLLDTIGGGKQTAKQIVTTALKQAGIEATTEEISLLGTLLAEAVILKEKSGYQQDIMTGILSGLSPTDAKTQATKNVINEAVNTALVSMVSGGASSVGGSVAANVRNGGTTQAADTAPKTKEELKAKYAEQETAEATATAPAAAAKAQPTAATETAAPQTTTQPVQAAQTQQQPQTQPVQAQTEGQPTQKKLEVSDIVAAITGKAQEAGNNETISTTDADKLWGKRDGENGWNEMSGGNSVWATALAMKEVNPEYFEAYMSAAEGEHTTPVIDAIVNAANDVRQESISPMAAATVINELYAEHGEDGLRQLYNHKNGNLYDSVLNRMKSVDESRANATAKATQQPQVEIQQTAQTEGVPQTQQAEQTASVAQEAPQVRTQSADTKKTAEKKSTTHLQYGQKVKASDRGNIGTVVSYNAEYNTYTVNFKSKSGTQKNVTLPAAAVSPVGKIIQPKTQSVQTTTAKTAADADTQQYTEDGRKLQRDRVNAVRDQEVTVTDKDGKTVTEFAGNAYQSSLTPDSFTDSIKRLVDEGQVSHDVQTNEESLKKGAQMIADEGSERNAVNKLRDMANSGKTSAEYIAMGTLLYQDLTAQIETQSKNGKVDPNIQQDAEDVFVSLSKLATNSGRALQLFNLYRKMSPDSQVNVLKKEVQSEVESLQKRGIVKKDYQTSIDPELTQMYRDAVVEFQKAKTDSAKTAAETKMQEIQNVIYAEEAAKMPTTFKAKWDAWRYMSMLGNAKTQIRNVVGNAVMMPYTEAKRVVGSALESVVIKDKSQRTKSVVSVVTDGELLSWASEDAKSGAVKDILSGTTKTSDTAKGIVEENIQTFGDSWAGKKLNTLQKAIGDVTQAGDFIFKSNEYSRSLASFLKARGYTATDAKTDGGIPTDVMNEARNYAIEEAARATFNDSNVVSDWFSSIGRKDDSNVIAKAANVLMEGVIPFRKTPANVLVRGWEYSPMGVLTTIGKTAVDIKNGEYSAAVAIDRVAANLTGTAAFGLGIALANGLGNVKLVGGNVDDDEERQGHQKYALEVTVDGETHSYTIDWAAPANLPLFMGANLVETLNNPSTESLLTAIADVGLNTLEPMLELSCLSGLNDFLEAGRYAEEGGVSGTYLAKAATSYITQGIPSLLRQASQASQETKQTTFTTSGDNTVKSLQRTAAGIPFAGSEYQTDKLNEWGETESTGTKAERIINAFINPGTYKKVDNSALEQEISRLNDAQETNVSPDDFPKTVSYTDKNGDYHEDYRLTEEEYQKYAQIQGQTAKAILSDMINNENYKAMDDEQKAKAFDMVYSYAKEKAKTETLGTDYGDSWMMDIKSDSSKAAEQIIRRTTSNAISNAVSGLDKAWDNGYSAENVQSYSSKLEEVYATYSKMTDLQKASVKDTATGTAARYISARESGISHDAIVSVFKSVNSLTPESGAKQVSQKQELETIAKASNLTEAQKVTVAKLYASDAQDKNIDEVKKLGGSYKLYTELYEDHADYTKGTGKKSRTISHWMSKYGWDYSTAKKYYEVFS